MYPLIIIDENENILTIECVDIGTYYGTVIIQDMEE